MQDTKKTKKQLIQELVALRQRLADGTVRIAIRTQVVAEQPEVVIHDTAPHDRISIFTGILQVLCR